MATIKFLESNGSTRYIFLVNHITITINKWKGGTDLLHQFILESEQLLLAKDMKLIQDLSSKYDLQTPYIFFLLCDLVFRESFMECFNSCGKSFLERGELFSAKKFCDLIYPSGGNIIKRGFSTLLHEAEKSFDYELAQPYLEEAFREHSIPKVISAYKTLKLSRFFHLAVDKLEKNFKTHLHYCAEKLFKKGAEVSYTGLCKLVFSTMISYTYLNTNQLEFVMEVVNHWRDKSSNENNKIRMKLDHPLWVIPYLDIQENRTVQLKFSEINSPLRIEIQEYLLYWFKKGESARALARRHHLIIRIARGIQAISPTNSSFLHLTYIEALQIFDVLQQMKSRHNKKFGLKTIQGSISEARLLFDWLKTKNLNETLKNPFRRLKFHNINSFVKNAKYIPDEVANQLSVSIIECPDHVQRVWLIMMNTGMRASEVLNLEEDCLIYNEKEVGYYLKFLSRKTLNQRRRMGLNDYHSVPILSSEIVDVIQQQIKKTEKLRDIGKTRYIFVKFANSHRRTLHQSITRYEGSTISDSINNCIKRNEIKDNQGNLWHYSNHQCRKTLAVKLLSEGSSLSDVGEILGHMVEKTTRQYYQDVDAMKIARLDQQLFEQLFETIDEKTRNAYTLFEFEQLKMEIMTGSRETPEGHGSCLKHVSFGPCKKHSCVGCSLLLTGPQKLSMWRKLQSEQQMYIDKMISLMKKQGIKDYESYRDFQSEYHLLTLYTDTINKIEKFIEKREPTNDHS